MQLLCCLRVVQAAGCRRLLTLCCILLAPIIRRHAHSRLYGLLYSPCHLHNIIGLKCRPVSPNAAVRRQHLLAQTAPSYFPSVMACRPGVVLARRTAVAGSCVVHARPDPLLRPLPTRTGSATPKLTGCACSQSRSTCAGQLQLGWPLSCWQLSYGVI